MEYEKDLKFLLIKFLDIIVGTVFIGIISIKLYYFLPNIIVNIYWVGIPLILFFFVNLLQRTLKKDIILFADLIIITLLSTVFIGLITKINFVNDLFFKYEEIIIIIIFFMFFISLAIKNLKPKENLFDDSKENNDLFNLFYINTSKVHEIAMLIDNKIMKTIEKQQSSEELLKSDYKLNMNKSGLGGASLSQVTENSKKKSVYESFDVKTTKSIMLKKIYTSIKNNNSNAEDLGNVLLFENVELKQRNTDDTVMVLNVLKDGNMKQSTPNDGFELNISKMMDEMLNDFTIDYTFDQDNKNYLIRIPYKANQYFENSYSHNDLQLGELSIIGIYRGEIDFSNIDSISSKFLELFSQSYHNELNNKNLSNENGLSLSAEPINKNNYEFNITPNQLNGKHHLIDLIAIIQEINIKEGEKKSNE